MVKVGYKRGRGHKAPYQTEVIRIPTDLRPLIEELCQKYKIEVSKTPSEGPYFTPITSVEATKLVRKILRSKKSARVSLTRLLKVLYPNSDWW